ncbi:MAG: S8/S53 family peptidase [Limisphaerales bacterium]
MNRLIYPAAVLVGIITAGFIPSTQAQHLDQIGVTLLRAVTTNVNGTGIRVAQPEASLSTTAPVWEVNPANVSQPVSLFTYISGGGSTNFFPNSLSTESGHADGVAGLFYGLPGGVATNIAHVDNYDADFFITNYIFAMEPMPAALVVNQSFTFGQLSVDDQQGVDSAYDDYADTFGTLFVSAVANGGQVCAPGTDYNCIAVAAYGGNSSVGPTIDNGRCKPDITAPEGATSFSTPQVSGAAALLLQAALRGDGGGDTNSVTDMRTIKVLLLNGAVKPANWTNSNSSPLDARFGAGVLNVFNAYEQLAGGKQSYVAATSVPTNSAHLPTGDTGTVSGLNGWDFNTNSSSASTDGVNHYYFNVTNDLSGAMFTATVTLAWNRQFGETNINDLDLFLFNAANDSLITCSTSRVDNVEHLWLPQLPPGRYDLQVLKNGGTNTVSDSENYALAWAFVSPILNIAKSGTNTVLGWAAYPAGYRVETATSLTSAWGTSDLPASIVTNGRNNLVLSATNALQFFRLRQPNF